MRILHGTITNLLNHFPPDPYRTVSTDSRWGRPLASLAWWSFIIALVSGAVLSFNYRPLGDVFVVVSKLTHLYPFGALFRKLHYLSGQFFLLFTMAHTLEHFLKGTYLRMAPAKWTRLLLTFLLTFPLMFTGFILKGDKQGIFAGEVMVNLAREIPMIGSMIADILLKPGETFFLRPYLHHTVILPFLVLFLLGGHQKRLLPEKKLGLPLLAIMVTAAAVWQLPPDIPPRANVPYVYGPWFFHGIQLLLRHGPPLWTGIVWPITPILLMATLSVAPASCSRWIWTLSAIFWLLHLSVLVLAWIILPRFPGGIG